MGERLRALLVEDNPTILKNLREMLEELGLVDVVGTVPGQADACEWMDSRTQGCDVAIIDMFLASGDGLGVLKHIAGYAEPPERVILTNYATEPIRQRCKALGAEAVFDKSMEIQELIDWLTQRVRH